MDDEVAKDVLEQREIEPRSGPRYLATLEVRAEWDDSDGAHIVTEGTTENVGPAGTLVHLPRRLPEVGGRVRLEVQDQEGKKLHVVTEVLRIERNPGHPLAALQLLDQSDEWRGLIWEPSAPRVSASPSEDLDDDEDEDEEDE